jgi:hypothetical protein
LSHPVLELIAFGMSLGNAAARRRIDPSMIRDDELRLLFLAMSKEQKGTIRSWFRMLGVNDDKPLLDALTERLKVDADHERTIDAMQEMLGEIRERKEQREREEKG